FLITLCYPFSFHFEPCQKVDTFSIRLLSKRRKREDFSVKESLRVSFDCFAIFAFNKISIRGSCCPEAVLVVKK
ncbi:MAG: hypothetical protein WCF65_08855, partial [Parachlamydiaceae bacterium]